eukprot:Hpha_TRINITY_DN5602_c0_g1::TRINITY_DN5602_c0_g1_i1::g.50597::m.50597
MAGVSEEGLRRRGGAGRSDGDDVDVTSRLDAEQEENRKLKRLLELQEENRRLKDALAKQNITGEDDDTTEPARRPLSGGGRAPSTGGMGGMGGMSGMSNGAASDPAGPPPPDFAGLLATLGQKNRLGSKLLTAMERLDVKHREILERKKGIDKMSDEEKQKLAQDFQEWYKESQEVMMMVTYQQLSGRKRKRRHGQRVLIFAVVAIFIALVIAGITRYTFFRPTIKGLESGDASPDQTV